MQCPNCKTENKDEALYCKKCGTKLNQNYEEDYYDDWEEENNKLLTKIIIATGVVVFIIVLSVFLFLMLRNKNSDKLKSAGNTEVVSQENTTEEKAEEQTSGGAAEEEKPLQSEAVTTAQEPQTQGVDNTVQTEPQTPIDAARKYTDNSVKYPVEFRGHAYALFDFHKLGLDSYDECVEYCKGMGGHMAVINSQEENDFLYNYVQKDGEAYTFFGFSDEEEEGNWKWVDGSPVTYTNWCLKEGEEQPNNRKGREHYAQFYGDMEDGTWCDAKFGSGSWKFLCEWE